MTVKPYTTTLSKDNAYWMARIAKAVYYKQPDDSPDEEKIMAELKADDSQFVSIKGVSKKSAQAALIEHENYFCFAFRGTDEAADWLDNMNVFSEKVLFGEFHRGFWKSLEDVWQPLYEQYEALHKQKRRPVFFTGHSLGGAMATVAASRFIHHDQPFSSTYTFGQPRVMSNATARIFNMEAKGRTFRFQNNNDIVTRVPARIMGYSHVGTYIYISADQELLNDPGFWNRFLDSVEGAVEAIGKKGVDAIEDHDMSKYLSAIQKWDSRL